MVRRTLVAVSSLTIYRFSATTARRRASRVLHASSLEFVLPKRLSQLAPLVFKAAFEDGDPLALNVLQVTSKELVDQISLMCRPGALRRVDPSESVLCFGGSLVGVAKYRDLVLEKLAEQGIVFKRWEFVDDAAAVGAKGLAIAERVA